MRVLVAGKDGPVARATHKELERRGHSVVERRAEAAIYFPGTIGELRNLLAGENLRRLVIRSHAFAYGSSPKNPGWMTEERVSLLPTDVPEQLWLSTEAAAAEHPNWAAVRLTNVLDASEGDLVVRQIASRSAITLAGRDPNVQFISVGDAARALVAAVESDATGVFNGTGAGTIPLRKALQAAGTVRAPLLKPIARMFGLGANADQLEYNWTISGERAAREIGFQPESSSLEALADFLYTKRRARPERLRDSYDDWGLDLDYIRAWGWWFAFLHKVYWRIESEGLENIPETGRGMFVSNHRGFMPLDAVMHLSMILTQRQRVVRFLIIHSLLRLPFLSNFLTRLGGVIASQENAAKLFAGGNLVGIFPEGIRGSFTPYKSTYHLREFSKSGFARIAIENQAPVIPSAVVGHAEIFPIIARIDWSWLTREYGWPYLPIAPMFPLAPVPIPSKWHIRVLPPVPMDGLTPADAGNPRIVKDFSRHIQDIIQRNIDDMLTRRKSIFYGRLLDGTAPQAPPFRAGFAQPAGGLHSV